MHRLIMTSAVYQQSPAFRKDAAEVDADNRLLWAFPRQRLDAEAIRDSALWVSGLLNPKAGGPSVFPELPTGMGALRLRRKREGAGSNRPRRGQLWSWS